MQPEGTLEPLDDYLIDFWLAIRNHFFRYDNAAHYPQHPTSHHKHIYEPPGNKLTPPEHVGAIPDLWEVLDDLGIWYSTHSRVSL